LKDEEERACVSFVRKRVFVLIDEREKHGLADLFLKTYEFPYKKNSHREFVSFLFLNK
jgi:hypothetical protein